MRLFYSWKKARDVDIEQDIFSTFSISNFILSPMVALSFSVQELQEEEVTAAEKELKEGTFSWGKGKIQTSPVLSQFSPFFTAFGILWCELN